MVFYTGPNYCFILFNSTEIIAGLESANLTELLDSVSLYKNDNDFNTDISI